MKKEEITQKINLFLNDKVNLLFLAVFILGIILRLKYLTINQGVWYDEGVYLSEAKNWVFNVPFKMSYVRPPLLPFIWAIFYKLGVGELTFRVILFLFSLVGLWLTYLIGKQMFNKYVGLIAATITAFHYLNLFYTARLLTDVPAMTLWLFAVYFFWQGYVNQKSNALYLMGLSFVLAVLMKFPSGLLGGVFILFLLLTRDLKFLKNKKLWASVGIFFIVFIPYAIWYYKTYEKIPVLGAGAFYQQELVLEKALSFMPTILMSPIPYVSSVFPRLGHFFVIALLVGLGIILFNLIIGWDMLRENRDLKKQMFILLWVVVLFAYFAYLPIVEDRYFFCIFPAFFMIIGWVFMRINDFLKKYQKFLGIAVIVFIILTAGYYQIKYADMLIKVKSNSFVQYREGGEWIKANSNPDDKVMATGEPMVVYYSERDVITFPDLEVETMEEYLERERPKYYVLSASEYSGEWTYLWPQEHPDKVVPVQAYYLDPEKTKVFLVIYRFKYD